MYKIKEKIEKLNKKQLQDLSLKLIERIQSETNPSDLKTAFYKTELQKIDKSSFPYMNLQGRFTLVLGNRLEDNYNSAELDIKNISLSESVPFLKKIEELSNCDIILNWTNLPYNWSIEDCYNKLLEYTHVLFSSKALNCRFFVLTNSTGENLGKIDGRIVVANSFCLAASRENVDIQFISVSSEGNKSIDVGKLLTLDLKETSILIKENGDLYAPRLISIESSQTSVSAIKTENAYLITGGMGRIGQATLKWLVSRGAKNIALVSRNPKKNSEQILKELNLPEDINLLVLKADISKISSLVELKKRLSESNFELSGVVHCAGVIQDASIPNQKPEMFEKVLEAKYYGALNLLKTFKSSELDFLINCSSTASIFGSPGQLNYTVTNALVDKIVNLSSSTKIYSINWGPWKVGGMADNKAAKSAFKKYGFFREVDNIYAEKLFDLTLSTKNTQIFGMEIDSKNLKESHEVKNYPVLENIVAKEKDFNESEENNKRKFYFDYKGKPKSKKFSLIEEVVKQVFTEALELPEDYRFENNGTFESLGVDSILSLEIRTKISKELLINLPASILYDFPTIQSLTKALFKDVEVKSKEIKYVPKSIQTTSVSSTEGKVTAAKKTKQSRKIAVVSMACRLPGGIDSPEEFWDALVNAKDLIENVPNSRWCVEDLPKDKKDISNHKSLRRGGIIKGVEYFDHELFGITPLEAKYMDPQQRLLLELTWNLLERGGYDPKKQEGKNVGVFVGPGPNTYPFDKGRNLESKHELMGTGNATSIIAGRIAYFLGIRGPVMTIDTACSSSLVSIHLASKAILEDELEYAIAGGINLILSPESTVVIDKAGMLSPDAKCNTFSENANGYVRADGAGLVLLKSLDKAIEDGDQILGVIEGGATNHDGKSQNLTAPSGNSQKELISKALQNAEISRLKVGFIETHGTGTSLGDPIEFGAICNTYLKEREQSNKLILGAVKTNIGHCESAAGVAGFIKAILCLENGVVPQNLNLKAVNPHLDLAQHKNIAFPTEIQKLPTVDNGRRFAGISSFGFSGTNCHLVLGNFKNTQPACVAKSDRFLAKISTLGSRSLEEVSKRYVKFLEGVSDSNLRSFCKTTLFARSTFENTHYFLVSNKMELISALKELTNSSTVLDSKSQVTIRFPDEIDYEGILADSSSFPPRVKELLNTFTSEFLTAEKNSLQNSSVRNFIVQCVSGKLLIECIEKDFVLVGHGIGKLVAGYLSGLFTFGDAMKVLLTKVGLNSYDLQDINFEPLEYELILTPESNLKDFTSEDFWKQYCKTKNQPHQISKKKDFIRCDLGNGQTCNLDFDPKMFETSLAELAYEFLSIGKEFNCESYLYFDAPFIVIPQFSFLRKKHWVDIHERQTDKNRQTERENLLIDEIAGQSLKVTQYNFDHSNWPYNVCDHKLFETTVIPGAFQIAFAIEEHLKNEDTLNNIKVSDIQFSKALTLNNNKPRKVQIHQQKAKNGHEYSTWSSLQKDSQWEKHASLTIKDVALSEPTNLSLPALKSRMSSEKEGSWFYEKMARSGYNLSGTFANIEKIYKGDNESLLLLKGKKAGGFSKFHAGIIDTCFQSTAMAMDEFFGDDSKIFIPFSVDSIDVYSNEKETMWIHVVKRDSTNLDVAEFDIFLLDENCKPLLTINRFFGKRAARSQLGISDSKLTYSLKWQKKDFICSPSNPGSKILVFADKKHGIELLPNYFRKENSITAVYEDEEFSAFEDEIYLDWGNDTHRKKLVSCLSKDRHDMIIDFSNISNDCSLKQVNKELSHSIKDAYFKITALNELGYSTKYFYFSKDAGDASQSLKFSSFTNSSLKGMLLTNARELPENKVKFISLDSSRVIDQKILDDILSPSKEEIISYNDGQKYVQKFVPEDFSCSIPTAIQTKNFYLVTGGLGGIGKCTIKWLNDLGAKKFIVIGRRNKDSVEKEVEELECTLKKGSTLEYMSGTIDSVADVKSIKNKIDQLGISIGTIVHGAGILQDGFINNQSFEDYFSVFKPKACGLVNLINQFGSEINFIVHSSLASVGSKGQSNYAGANSFIDHVTGLLSDKNKNTKIFNWGLWNNVGLSSQIENKAEHYKRIGTISLNDAEKVFKSFVKQDKRQIYVFPSNIVSEFKSASTPVPTLFEDLDSESQISGTLGIEESKGTKKSDRINFEKLDPSQLNAVVENTVLSQISDITGMSSEDISMNRGLQDAGVNSLMALELRKGLNEAFGLELSSTIIYNYPNPGALIGHISHIILEKKNQQSSARNKIKKSDTKSSDFIKESKKSSTEESNSHDEFDSLLLRLDESMESLKNQISNK